MVKLYADTSRMRTRQIVLDLVVAGWIALWIVLGTYLHDLVLLLAVPGEGLADIGASLASAAERIGDTIDDAPLIGGEIAAPFFMLRDTAGDLVGVGEATQQAAQRLALWLGVATAGAPIAIVAVPYLLWREAWVRQAAAVRRLYGEPATIQLLALRAAVRRPLRQVHRVSQDPIRDLRERPEELAVLELRHLGLEPPTETPPRERD